MVTPAIWRNTANVQRAGISLGTALDDGRIVSLPTSARETGTWLLGPPGSGKTRVMLHNFNQAGSQMNEASVFFNFKGAAGRDARALALAQGQGKRLIYFDLTEREHVIGFNPLRPNGLPPMTHAKAVREAILASWGQYSIDA